MTNEPATLTITAAGETRLNERLSLSDDGMVWLTWTFSLGTPEEPYGCGYDTESEILGQIGSRGLWKAVPHQLMERSKTWKTNGSKGSVKRAAIARAGEHGFYLGLEVENWEIMTTLISGSAVTDEGEPSTYVDQDGYLVDVATGEVLGISEEVTERWQVESHEGADWVLERMSRHEADIVALEARRKAINRNLDSLIADKRRRLAWLEWRFRPCMIEWARSMLAGGKKRTLQLTHGKIAFRMGVESHRIVDMEAAVQSARDWDATKAIKVVETIGVKTVQEIQAGIVKSMGVADPTPWFVTEPAEESVKIETGIHTTREER